jgi:hypothetical protein
MKHARWCAIGALLVVVAPVRPAIAVQKEGARTVIAAVVDGSGKPFADIPRDEWVVKEDGADRSIVSVRPSTTPIQMILLVDTTRGTQAAIVDVRAGVSGFVKRVQSGNDAAIAVRSVGGASTMVADFGKSGADLDRPIQRLFPDESAAAVMLESIVDGAKALEKRPSPRRLIVALNLEGFPEASTVTPQNVANAVLASGASLWAVSYRNAASNTVSARGGNEFEHGAPGPGGANTGQNRDVILNNLTTQTGGARLTVMVPSAIQTSLNQIADVLLAQYEVTYVRPEGARPKQLQVAVGRAGAHVLATRTPPR